MSEADRLRHLQVGEPGQDDVDVALRQIEQGLLQLGEQTLDQVDLAAQPQAHVGGDLVVAAAAGVQPLAGVTGQLREPGLDIEVHVLQFQLPVELAGLDLLGDACHPVFDRLQVGCAEDALGGQHAGMGQRAFDVGAPQAPVKTDAGGVTLDQFAHRLRKQGRPAAGFVFELTHGRGKGASWVRPVTG